MQDNHILLVCVDAVERDLEVVERVVVSYRHEDRPGTHAKRLGRQLVAGKEVELIELRLCGRALLRRALRDGEHGEKDEREYDARDRRHLLGQQIRHAQRKQNDGNHGETDRDLRRTDLQVQRHAKVTFAWLLEAQHQDRQALQGKTPHHPERVRLAEDEDVSAAQEDRDELQADDQVQDAV